MKNDVENIPIELQLLTRFSIILILLNQWCDLTSIEMCMFESVGQFGRIPWIQMIEIDTSFGE